MLAHGRRTKGDIAMQGVVIWITGLSGAGKTTLGTALQEKLPGSILLDGDALRRVLASEQSGYDAGGRKNLALTYARLARMLALQNFMVIVATISLFHEVHAWNRANLPGYLEVFLDVPASVREARDPKGLYAGAKKGSIANVAGDSVNVEWPLNPDIVLTEKDTPQDSVACILAHLAKKEGQYS